MLGGSQLALLMSMLSRRGAATRGATVGRFEGIEVGCLSPGEAMWAEDGAFTVKLSTEAFHWVPSGLPPRDL